MIIRSVGRHYDLLTCKRRKDLLQCPRRQVLGRYGYVLFSRGIGRSLSMERKLFRAVELQRLQSILAAGIGNYIPKGPLQMFENIIGRFKVGVCCIVVLAGDML